MCYEVTRWFGVCSSLVLGRFDSKSGLLVVWMKSTEFPCTLAVCLHAGHVSECVGHMC